MKRNPTQNSVSSKEAKQARMSFDNNDEFSGGETEGFADPLSEYCENDLYENKDGIDNIESPPAANANESNLSKNIKNWAHSNNVSHLALNGILDIMSSAGLNVPVNSKNYIQTPSESVILPIDVSHPSPYATHALLLHLTRSVKSLQDSNRNLRNEILNLKKCNYDHQKQIESQSSKMQLLIRDMKNKRTQQRDYRTTGGGAESPAIIDLNLKVPLQTIKDIEQLEADLADSDYEKEFRRLIAKYSHSNLRNFISKIFTDESLKTYNWDGKQGKMPFKNFNVLLSCLYDTFRMENLDGYSLSDFEVDLKGVFKKAHNNLHVFAYRQKKNSFIKKEVDISF